MLVGWIFNYYRIVIRQGRYKVLPLHLLYVLMLTLILIWLYYSIWFTHMIQHSQLFPIISKYNLKFCMGIVQCSINIELSLTLSNTLKQIQSDT